MTDRFSRWFIVLGALVAASISVSPSAHADVFTNAVVGGAPTGVNYVNFEDLALGAGGGTSGGIGVSFTSDGQAVQGAVGGQYAAPFLSSSNGFLFGDNTVSGADKATYLTTGLGSVTLIMPGVEKYFGILWGSVDGYNTLSFYKGGNLVRAVTGTDVNASANGDQGANGTFYVNFTFTGTDAFDKVVAKSSQYAFEFDNVSYNPTVPTPEPSTMLIGGAGLLVACFAKRRGRRTASAA
jgi:hypothetical protein